MPENRVAEFWNSVVNTPRGSYDRRKELNRLNEDISLLRDVIDYVYDNGGVSSSLGLKMLFSDDLLGQVVFDNAEAVHAIITGLRLKDTIANQNVELDLRRKALDVLVSLGKSDTTTLEANTTIMTDVVMTDDTIMVLFGCLTEEDLRDDIWKNLLIVLDNEERALPIEAFEVLIELCRNNNSENRLIDREQIERFLLNLTPIRQSVSQIYDLIDIVFASYLDASGLVTLAVKKLEEFGTSGQEEAGSAIKIIRQSLSRLDTSTFAGQSNQRELCIGLLNVFKKIVDQFEFTEEAYLEDLRAFLECDSARVRKAAQGTISSIRSALRSWIMIIDTYTDKELDKEILDGLVNHFRPHSSRVAGCEIWHKQGINPGAVITENKERAIEKAKLIVVMLTIDLVNNKDARNSLLEPICNCVDDGDKIVLSSLQVRPCDYRHLNMRCMGQVEPDIPLSEYKDINSIERFLQIYASRLFDAAFPEVLDYSELAANQVSETISPLPPAIPDKPANAHDKASNEAKQLADKQKDSYELPKRSNP